MTFFDTNVLIYAATPADPRCAIAAARLAGGGTISVQVLNEFVSVALRKLSRNWTDVRSALPAIRALRLDVRPITEATHLSALHLAERHTIAFYDAVIVASALEAGCTTLLTEDMQHGRVIAGTLTIHNPFRP